MTTALNGLQNWLFFRTQGSELASAKPYHRVIADKPTSESQQHPALHDQSDPSRINGMPITIYGLIVFAPTLGLI